MAYSFDQVFAADPSNPANIAQDASVTIFAPGDPSMTPLTITDPDGQPLSNPLTVNANGFGSAFMHATLDRVAWAGGGFTGFFTSYEGMKQVAIDAQIAASTAASNASAAAVADIAARLATDEFRGEPGADGSNVLPTDTAIAVAASTPGSETDLTLKTLYAAKGEVRLTVAASDSTARAKARADYVCTGTGDLATIQAAVDALPDNNAVSGEVELLPGNYNDATGATVSIGSPTSSTLNPRKIVRFHRGARVNAASRTGRKAVFKVESPDCQVINPNIAGSTGFGNGTGIAIGGDVTTFGGRWDRVANRVRIDNPIISNMDSGIEFSSIDGGPGVGGSTGDCIVDGGYVFQNKTGIRAAGYTNTVIATQLSNNNKPIWVEGRRSEAQIRTYGVCIVGWNEVGIAVDGGFGSVFRDTWMEHTSATGSTATEAIRFGTSTTRANFTRFSGATHVQLINEQYAVKYVSASNTKIEDLILSTSGTVPSTAIIRNELASTSKRNRIERITFGPNAIPSHTTLSIDPAAWGEVFIDRVPGTTGSDAFSTRINPSTRSSSSPVVRKTIDSSKTSDATLAAESEMTMNLTPATNYALTGLIIFDANQAADFKMQLSISGTGGTVQWTGTGPASSHTSALGISSVTTQQASSGFVQAWGGAAAGTPVAVPITGIVKTTDLSTLTMSWAQATADATPTILKNGSWLKLEPMP